MSDELIESVNASSVNASSVTAPATLPVTPATATEEAWHEAPVSDPSAHDLAEPEAQEVDGVDFAQDGMFAAPPPLLYRRRPTAWPSVRTPNFADFGIFFMMLILGFLVAAVAIGFVLFRHSFGLRSYDDIQNNTGIALATQVLIYVVGLGIAIPFFRIVWGKGFFSGIHWNAGTVRRFPIRLIFTAVLCNVIAMVGNLLLPFPQHAPIDKLFGTSADAWMLMIFGVTVAPFFEELIFRGFLVPALATAWDWSVESSTGRTPRPLDANGHPEWGGFAMLFAALVASVPFTLMHAAQVGQAWGPLLLLYCVSLILCIVRLATRSLAASTLVHSTYNFLLFAMMLWQTGGFRHMDKM